MEENHFDELLLNTDVVDDVKRVVNAYMDGEHIGHVSYSLGFKGNENEVSIDTMGVDNLHKRRGVARIMLEYIIGYYGEFTIHSGASNDAARLLQEGIGFTTIEPYRLKRDGANTSNTKSLRDISPPSTSYKLPKVMVKVNTHEDLETMYRLSGGHLDVLEGRLQRILSYAIDKTNGYEESDYSKLYLMIDDFMKKKTAVINDSEKHL